MQLNIADRSRLTPSDDDLLVTPSKSKLGIQRTLGFYYAHKFGNLFLASFFQIFIAKVLTPSNYATYAILLAIILVSERLLSFGLDRTIMRFVPSLTARRDFASLRWLFVRMGLVRALSLILMALVICLAAPSVASQLPTSVSITTIYAFAFWFASTSLFSDTDALAQSWMAHIEIAAALTLEIVARCTLISLLAMFGFSVDASLVIVVSALTNTFALLGLGTRLLMTRRRVTIRQTAEPDEVSSLEVREAPMFAAAAYASTLGWLTTSPAAVRIVSKGGLDVVAFASFSFIQTLCISLQRAFPGLLVLPSLEPILAGQAWSAQRDRMFATMSFVFKVELIAVLSTAIVMGTIGAELITLLSRSAYAPYFYVLPFLLVVLVLQTLYRIFEIVMSVDLQHRLLLTLWPISVLSVASLYFSVSLWGLWSVLLVPIAEGAMRVGIILLIYRRAKMWRAFDPARSLQLVAFAALVLMASALVFHSGIRVPGSSIGIAAACVGLFSASLFIIRPFRPSEVKNLAALLPSSLSMVERLAYFLARK